MLDLEAAREVVAARERERIDALVAQEAARQEHNRMMAETSAAMMAGQARAKAQRQAAHTEAVAEARAAKDHLAALVAVRERCESKLGFSKADLEAAQKNAAQCVAPSADDYPTPGELDAHRQRRAQLDEEVMHIQGRIAAEQAALDRARSAELDALDRFKVCERDEWERRSAL
jgi:hypothetical protein